MEANIWCHHAKLICGLGRRGSWRCPPREIFAFKVTRVGSLEAIRRFAPTHTGHGGLRQAAPIMRAAGGFKQTPVIDGILEPRPAAETWAIRAGRCQDDPVGFCHGRFGEDSRITAGHKYNRGRITAAAFQGSVQNGG